MASEVGSEVPLKSRSLSKFNLRPNLEKCYVMLCWMQSFNLLVLKLWPCIGNKGNQFMMLSEMIIDEGGFFICTVSCEQNSLWNHWYRFYFGYASVSFEVKFVGIPGEIP